jgi:hypothetical protein
MLHYCLDFSVWLPELSCACVYMSVNVNVYLPER